MDGSLTPCSKGRAKRPSRTNDGALVGAFDG